MSDFQMDWDRQKRCGVTEAVLCASKSPAQIKAILAEAADRPLLLTRLHDSVAQELIGDGATLDYCPVSQSAVYGHPPAPVLEGALVVCAGTSDLSAAREAVRTLEFHGYRTPLIADVGVAGLWRLMNRLDDIRHAEVVIAAAGMEGALFSVLGGLIDAPLIALPTSVGYGVAAQGRAALHSALASCAAGITVVNIDNGFGAACAALRILNRFSAQRSGR